MNKTNIDKLAEEIKGQHPWTRPKRKTEANEPNPRLTERHNRPTSDRKR